MNEEYKKPRRKPPIPFVDNGRLPPQNTDVEEVVLGSLMLEPDTIGQIVNLIKPEIFYKDAHQKICSSILELYDKRKPIDILTVTEQLKKDGTLETVGGPYYVTQLTNRVGSSAHIQYHISIIYQKYLQRELIRICHDTGIEAYEDTTDIFDLYDKHKEALKAMNIETNESKTVTLQQSVDNVFDDITEQEKEQEQKIETKRFYKCHLKSANDMLMFSKANMLLLGGAKGHGKTSLLSDIIFGLLENNPKDISILWYSMEDLPENIVRNFISRRTFITNSQLQGMDYTLSKEEVTKVKQLKNKFLEFDIEFVGKRSKIKNIQNHFTQFKEKRKGSNKLFILIIDNMMKLSDMSKGKQSGKLQTDIDDSVAEVLGDIYDENKEDSFIVVVHHFNQEQTDKKNLVNGYQPREEHFRGSKRFIDIMTQVILINRLKNYSDLLAEYKKTPYYDVLRHLMVIECIHNRNVGKTGFFRLLHQLDYKYFIDL